MLSEDAIQKRSEASVALFDNLTSTLKSAAADKNYDAVAKVGDSLANAISRSQQAELTDSLSDEVKKLSRKAGRNLDLKDLD